MQQIHDQPEEGLICFQANWPENINTCTVEPQIIKRSDITKPSYNKEILLVPALYISLFFTLI